MNWVEAEKQKYQTVWNHAFYREQADGDKVVKIAFEKMDCETGETLIDWGCGCGRPASKLQALGLKVTGFDIAENCLDKGSDVNLVVGCLWDPPPELHSHYAFCTDVLEHIPPDLIDQTLDIMFRRTKKAAFIQVCTVPDSAGRKIEPPQVLHLTVRPKEWWLEQLQKRWQFVEQLPGGGKSRACYVCWR